jgi:hypothetical protein
VGSQTEQGAVAQLAVEIPLATILDEIHAFLRRFISFTSDTQPVVIALWVVHTWFIEAFEFTPYLHILSPTKQCGKSRLLDCLALLVRNVWRAVSMSVAALFRTIEKDQPTLLMDEVDAVFTKGNDDGSEDLRAMLNAGFERGSKVRRCVGSNFDVKDFAVFCPKALAGIGKVPDTISDRCIPIHLVRKKKAERVQRFRKREVNVELLVANLRWHAQKGEVIETLRNGRAELNEISDRQNDIAEPLIVIADMAGGDWPDKARRSLIELFSAKEEDNIGVQLLADIKTVFEEKDVDRLPTHDLLRALVELETIAPWAAWWAKDIADGRLQGPGAKLRQRLTQFGLSSKTIRMPDDATPKGFLRADFEAAWERYLCS